MKNMWGLFIFAGLIWGGCGSMGGGAVGSSGLVRPEPVKTNQGTLYVHPVTKQPFNGEYDVVEAGVRLKFGIKNGLEHGRFQRWYPSGKIHEEYNLVKKQRNGLQRSWYPNGQLMLEANFRNGLCLNAKTWAISGGVASTVTNGSGTILLFDTKGQKRRESVYKDGIKQ